MTVPFLSHVSKATLVVRSTSINNRNQDRWLDNALDTRQVVDQMRLKSDYDQLVLVGHSFGASSAILCEFYFPGTFDGLCVIEPVMSDNFPHGEILAKSPILTTLKRRDEWRNR